MTTPAHSQEQPQGKKRSGRLYAFLALGLAAILALVCAAGAYAYLQFTTSGFKRALPSSASDVRELNVDMFPDYVYYFRARMPEADFLPYVQSLGLTPHTGERIYTDDKRWLSWGGGSTRPAWFAPSSSLAGTFVSQAGRMWILAKYEGGCVYILEYTH